ncbi:hypothetical protein HWD35_20070 [Tsukamurella tyrosinosolvens]|uniref:Uncharacterized protein n=1 Tax=Tsukamurella tyrosinosolvens TaxID=57704 RepID=A0A1H4PH89_TSUTY|nr:hypothetical protein [Tsukamurella tyrosinosolvens]KXO97649.1 hypothetical protein AXK58_09075 [Tsukamurella tyrosinosolvens]KXP09054.1 hypothetical protein AXK59_00135 [Tsukamurella tyrosinosolvens]KZL97380.1 hypothetical protein AXX05_16675 [Tsukamurella tyrosinosolvens]MCA4997020.1 hypothetical protein [Tsukamurella tyrosinosolvens]QRY86400.1 hypothetical protein JVY00_10320 [Tsukamurella tyrosinosolvens]
MLISTAPQRRLGVPHDEATLRIDQIDPDDRVSTRYLFIEGTPALELSFWTGTSPFLFERKTIGYDISDERVPLDRLERGLDLIDDEVVATFSGLLPEGEYLPLLVEVTPELVAPYDDRDYFTHEQVATWGIDTLWGLPQNPLTHYYRTFETEVAPDEHLFEFVVPMVQPNWNDQNRVQHYVDLVAGGTTPTAVALSMLDRRAPAVIAPDAVDYYEHWAVTHFLLDGHHKFEAAARVGAPLRLLALVNIDESLAGAEAVAELPDLLRRAPSKRRSKG